MYRVHLDRFEGPLDLLLFFIRRDELDVHDIPIARVADEFLDAVRAMEHVDLDAAAEFIHTAALLIQIKARMLLPRAEVGDDGEPLDPRRELVERLVEYMRYKEAATHLDGRWDARRAHATRGTASAPDAAAEPLPVRAGLFDLLSAFAVALRRSSEAPPALHAVARESYAMEAQRAWLLGALAGAPGAGRSFARLVSGRSRAFVIATFLAALDLLHHGAARLVLGAAPEDFALAPADGAPTSLAA